MTGYIGVKPNSRRAGAFSALRVFSSIRLVALRRYGLFLAVVQGDLRGKGGGIIGERRIGELLGAGGLGQHGGDRKSSDRASLDEFGITKKQSHHCLSTPTTPSPPFGTQKGKGPAIGAVPGPMLVRLLSLSGQDELCSAAPCCHYA